MPDYRRQAPAVLTPRGRIVERHTLPMPEGIVVGVTKVFASSSGYQTPIVALCGVAVRQLIAPQSEQIDTFPSLFNLTPLHSGQTVLTVSCGEIGVWPTGGRGNIGFDTATGLGTGALGGVPGFDGEVAGRGGTNTPVACTICLGGGRGGIGFVTITSFTSCEVT